jgi:hypothetical protein
MFWPASLRKEPVARHPNVVKSQVQLGNTTVLCRAPVWDIGSIEIGKPERFSHVFQVENVGKVGADIKRLVASCGCIAAEPATMTLGAGQAVDVPLTINVPPVPGAYAKSLTLELESKGSRGSLVMLIQGSVIATTQLRASPKEVDFGLLESDERRTRTVRLSRYDNSAVKFVRGTPKANWIALESPRSLDAADSVCELPVTIDASLLNPGATSSYITLETNSSASSSIVIPIRARIEGPDIGNLKPVVVTGLLPAASLDCVVQLEAASELAESVSYIGDAPIEVALMPLGAAEDSRRTIRVSAAASTPLGTTKKGMLLIKLAGSPKPIRVPLFVAFPAHSQAP